MEDDQQFCLRWNNHQSTLVSVFDNLLEKGIHVDCTLAAEGQTLKAHKVVLSACSPYFENVLLQQFDKHPIIILKDVKFAELKAMMDYMYRGEVNISQDQLAALLKAAESLQIKGLSDNKPSRPPSRPPHANNAHPQRAPSPKPQARDSSVDSRDGSVSPTRRRKKVRRMSTDLPNQQSLTNPTVTPADHDDSQCKEETTRDGGDELTIDEEDDKIQPHNDVVRNFEWHMERSRDDMMNSSDSIRDSQAPSIASALKPPYPIREIPNFKEEDDIDIDDIIIPYETPVTSVESCYNEGRIVVPIETPAPSVESVASKLDGRKIVRRRKRKLQKNIKKREKPNPFSLPIAIKDVKSEVGTEDQIKMPRKRKCSDADKIYVCSICKTKKYKYRRNKLRHEKYECTTGPQFSCHHCGRKYSQKKTLVSHINLKHLNWMLNLVKVELPIDFN